MDRNRTPLTTFLMVNSLVLAMILLKNCCVGAKQQSLTRSLYTFKYFMWYSLLQWLVEGQWYLHLLFFNAFAYDGTSGLAASRHRLVQMASTISILRGWRGLAKWTSHGTTCFILFLNSVSNFTITHSLTFKYFMWYSLLQWLVKGQWFLHLFNWPPWYSWYNLNVM
jgi:hypothetical protein